jgi:hypothetical protein
MGDHCHITAEIEGQQVQDRAQDIILAEEEDDSGLPQIQRAGHLSFSVKNDRVLTPGTAIRIKIDSNKLIVL